MSTRVFGPQTVLSRPCSCFPVLSSPLLAVKSVKSGEVTLEKLAYRGPYRRLPRNRVHRCSPGSPCSLRSPIPFHARRPPGIRPVLSHPLALSRSANSLGETGLPPFSLHHPS